MALPLLRLSPAAHREAREPLSTSEKQRHSHSSPRSQIPVGCVRPSRVSQNLIRPFPGISTAPEKHDTGGGRRGPCAARCPGQTQAKAMTSGREGHSGFPVLRPEVEGPVLLMTGVGGGQRRTGRATPGARWGGTAGRPHGAEGRSGTWLGQRAPWTQSGASGGFGGQSGIPAPCWHQPPLVCQDSLAKSTARCVKRFAHLFRQHTVTPLCPNEMV